MAVNSQTASPYKITLLYYYINRPKAHYIGTLDICLFFTTLSCLTQTKNREWSLTHSFHRGRPVCFSQLRGLILEVLAPKPLFFSREVSTWSAQPTITGWLRLIEHCRSPQLNQVCRPPPAGYHHLTSDLTVYCRPVQGGPCSTASQSRSSQLHKSYTNAGPETIPWCHSAQSIMSSSTYTFGEQLQQINKHKPVQKNITF